MPLQDTDPTPSFGGFGLNHEQTTSYTEMVEVEPNRLLMVYDRTPFGWNPVPPDSEERSRVFVLPINVERT